ncbi:MAG: hypothetical protein ACTSWN_11840, partial [Promethearchaeota archaeon]
MADIQAEIEKLKENFQVEELGGGKVKVYVYISNEMNYELEIDLNPVAQGKKPKIGFEKGIKNAIGNINKTLSTLANWDENSSVVNVLYELEDKLIEYSTSKFSVMDEIYILVDNYGPRATFEGKVARVKLQDIRKQEYLVTIDATEYPKLKLKFPQKLIEKIGDPEELRWAQKWGGHLWELAE